MGYLMLLIIIIIPIAAIVFFIVSLCLFLIERRKSRENTVFADETALSSRKTMLIFSAVILGVIVVIYVGLYIMLMLGIKNM